CTFCVNSLCANGLLNKNVSYEIQPIKTIEQRSTTSLKKPEKVILFSFNFDQKLITNRPLPQLLMDRQPLGKNNARIESEIKNVFKNQSAIS
ncbi:hypothetical protein, partial [uncultured Parasutterella sp.]|uniref:hypothetical protein n=1 Tax=uncultured Parasutterella sp. TaxID=1263098 RepID=UPI0025B5A63A